MLILRMVGMLGYLLLALLVLGFIFSNRTVVTVELFPFGHTGELPLYLLLSILFAMGLLLGLVHSASVWLGMRRKLRRANRALAQLEKEIAAKPAGTP